MSCTYCSYKVERTRRDKYVTVPIQQINDAPEETGPYFENPSTLVKCSKTNNAFPRQHYVILEMARNVRRQSWRYM